MFPYCSWLTGSPLRMFYAVLTAVAATGVAAIVWLLLAPGFAATQPARSAVSPASGIAIGRDSAPVVIYEFADFQCPGCARFAESVMPLVKQRLVDSGMVRFVYYDFPLPGHRNAFQASRAARCAHEQDRFWEYHDQLYSEQNSWARLERPAPAFLDLASGAGLEMAKFADCLNSDRYSEVIARSLMFGASLDVRGTPTLMLDGEKLSPRAYSSVENLERLVREKIASTVQGEQARP